QPTSGGPKGFLNFDQSVDFIENFLQVIKPNVNLCVTLWDESSIFPPTPHKPGDKGSYIITPINRHMQGRTVPPPNREGLFAASHRQPAIPENLFHPLGRELHLRVTEEDQAPVRWKDQNHVD